MSSILLTKSIQFSVNLLQWIKHNRHIHYSIINQLLKSGTATGALISEAQFAESQNDFIHKLRIARKECNETKYWFIVILKSGHAQTSLDQLMFLNTELLKMLNSSINTSLNKLKRTS